MITANDNYAVPWNPEIIDVMPSVIGYKHAFLLNTLGFKHVGDLAQTNEGCLRLLPGMGPARLGRLREALKRYGIALPVPQKPRISLKFRR